MSISRRRKRSPGDGRGEPGPARAGMMLTSLMDIFIVLVLYLLVNQSDGISLEPPDHVVLPDSGVDTVPRRSIVITLSDMDVRIQGVTVASMADIKATDEPEVEAIREAILRIKAAAQTQKDQAGLDTEVTIVADRFVPFKVLKKIMLSSSNAGYGKISFAVNQK
jgi:biopolymer transport protein ExbD